MGVVFHLLFIPVDYIRLRPHFETITALRIAACAVLLLLCALIRSRAGERVTTWIAALAVAALAAPIIGVVVFAAGPQDPLYLVQMLAVVFLVMGIGLLLPLDGRTTFLMAGIPVLLQVFATRHYPLWDNLPVVSASAMAVILAAVGAETSFVARLGAYQGRLAQDALDRARTDFVAMLTHDIKNPLGVIAGYTEMLRDLGNLTPEAEAYVFRIEGATRSALLLATNFLEVSKIDAGAVRLERAPVDVAHVLTQVVDQHNCLARAKGVSLVEEYAASDAEVDGDRLQLERVFANLLSNAISHTGPGGTIRVAARPADSRTLEVLFEDTGPGLSTDTLSRLFRRYSDAASRADSSGLGLFIAKSIAEAHGGRVNAENRESGRGACFRVVLPVRGEAFIPGTNHPS